MNANMPNSELSHQPPLAIVGLSALFPKSDDADQFWSNIRQGVDAISEVPATHWNPDDYFDSDQKSPDMTYARRGGFLSPVPFDPLEYGISPNNLEAIDTSQLLGMVAAKRALEHAGYGAGRQFDRSRVGCILGVTGTLEMVIPLGARLGHPKWRTALRDAGVPDDVANDVVQRISESYVPWQENSFPGLLGNVVAGRIANRLDLHGTNCVVDAACASSLSAIHLAALELWTGRSDMVVTGGIDTFNDIFMFMCFSKTPALSATGDAKPFSENADGTILGEGVGIIVLKRLDDAERDGDRIFAVLKGIGTSSDGAGNAVYAPKAEGQIRCLQDAYRVADVSPDTIELVEAHGTGTKVGDATEVSGLLQVYKATGRKGQWCAVGSIKSQIGHTKAAAGAAGIIKAILALQHRVLPPTIKVSQPPAALLAADSPFYVNTEARPWLKPDGYPRRAGVSAFGFGGSNFHCVLEESPQRFDAPDWDGDVQIVALSGSSQTQLSGDLQTWIQSEDWASVRNRAAASRVSFRPEREHRLVFVIERDKTDTAKLVAGALTMLDKYADRTNWSTPDGVYYGRGVTTGKLGVLFPGQGSQYPGMLRELACRFPVMNDVLSEANEVFATRADVAQGANGKKLSDYVYPTPSWTPEDRGLRESELRQTQIAQPAIGAVSLGALAVLELFGVNPEAVAGHSYGELTALCASRRFAPKTLYRLSMLRGRLMAEAQEVDGGMLAVGAPLTQVEAAIREMAVDLVVANYNSPNQVVLSGRIPEIDRATELFSQRNLRGKKLQVAAAFHSPLVATASRAFRPELESVDFAPSQMPVYANSTATEYPADPHAARDLLASQLARPVNFVNEIEQMYADGVRTFLEVGPGGVLTGLVNSILSGRQFRAVALDSSNGRRGGVFDLAHTLAQLAASGHSIRLDAWDPRTGSAIESAPSKRLRIPICGANYVKPRTPLPPRPPIASSSMQIVSEPQLSTTARPNEINGQPPATESSPPAVPAAAFTVPAVASHPVQESTAPISMRAVQTPSLMASHPASNAAYQPLSSDLQATIQDNLKILQRMQDETARIHLRFLESQESALRTFEELARRQLDLAPRHVVSTIADPAAPPSLVTAPVTDRPEASVKSVATAVTNTVLPNSVLANTVLAVVSEKTGYPTEMLSLEMSLDHDLGIDSIKRVEILSALQERVANLPAFKPEELGALHTLMDVVTLAEARSAELNGGTLPNNAPAPTQAQSSPHAPQTVAAPAPIPVPVETAQTVSSPVSTALTETVLAVVSEKTGYPTEMLSLEMSLDHDLGIDSIKRVEILSALQERVDNLPAFKPEELGALHTLLDVVTLAEARSAELNGTSPVNAPAPTHASPHASQTVAAPAPSPVSVETAPVAPSLASTALTETVLAVVSEKTGYPTEMLSLEMSLDHDLGIDSIKRVEILSALQERVDNLPAFKPEELGALHTLMDVVTLAKVRSAEQNAGSSPINASLPANPPSPQLSVANDTAAVPGTDRAVAIDSWCSQPSTLVRSIVQAVSLPPVSSTAELPVIRGAEIWITEDGLELSLRIAAELSQRGFKPRVINLDEPFVSLVPERLAGLIIVAPADGTHDRHLWRSIEWLQKAAPALRRTAAAGTCVFATVSRLDGQFGIDARQSLADPLSGGLAGLTKSAAREWPELNCKAIDLSSDWPSASEAAVRVVDELFRQGPVEIGLSPQGRCTPKVVDESLNSFRSHAPAILPGELVIVSGGARGVTAEAALAVAQSWKCRLVILGRSPIPPDEPEWLQRLSTEVQIKQGLMERLPRGTLPKAIEAQYRQILAGREITSTLSRLQAVGVPVSYHAVDIRDLAIVRPLVLQLQEEFGPVRGIIHGAGVLADQRIEDKTRDQFDRVYQTKVAGLRNLLGAIRPDELQMLCLFSSYTARYGRVGQCDYAIANEVLNKLARQFSIEHSRSHVVSFNWGPWDGGMVTGSLKKLFTAEQVGLIPLSDGARLLVQELSQGTSRPVEILVLGKMDAPSPASPTQVESASHENPATAPQSPVRSVSSNILLSGDPGTSPAVDPVRQPGHPQGSSNVLLSAIPGEQSRATVPVPVQVRPQGSSNVLLAGTNSQPSQVHPPTPNPSGSSVFAEIGQANSNEPGELKIAFEKTLDVKQYPFLESHVIGGKAVLPVAVILEWLSHGAIHHNPGLELEGFDDFRVFHGVRMDRHSGAALRVMVGRTMRADGRFVVRTQLVGHSDGRDVVHAAGTVILTSQYSASPDPRLQIAPQGYSLDMATAYATKLFHGTHLQGIAAVEACSRDGIVVDSRTSPAPWAWMCEPLRSAWIADPLSIDTALQAVILWSQEIQGIPCLPCSIASYRQFRKVFPHTGVKIVVKVTHATEHTIRTDVEFLDLEGMVVATMTGCESIADASLAAAFKRNRLD